MIQTVNYYFGFQTGVLVESYPRPLTSEIDFFLGVLLTITVTYPTLITLDSTNITNRRPISLSELALFLSRNVFVYVTHLEQHYMVWLKKKKCQIKVKISPSTKLRSSSSMF